LAVNETPVKQRPAFLRRVVPAVTSTLILAFILRTQSFDTLLISFDGLLLWPFAAAAVVHLLMHFIAVPLIWHRVLADSGRRIEPRALIAFWIGSTGVRNLAPLKLGNLAGVAYLRLANNLSIAEASGSLLVLHGLKLLGNVIWVAAGIGMFLFGWTGAVSWGAAAILAFSWFLPGVARIAESFAIKLPRIGDAAQSLARSFTEINSRKLLRLLTVATVYQTGNIVKIALAFYGAGLIIPLTELIARAPWVPLIAGIPITTMGLGAREASMVHFFAGFGDAGILLATGLALSVSTELVAVCVSLVIAPLTLRHWVTGKVDD
jgi:lysylphosphatidylglycerol synthase-like protein